MSDDLPDIHPEQAEIEKAAQMAAAYYNLLVFKHNVHPDNATALTQTFIELAFQHGDD